MALSKGRYLANKSEKLRGKLDALRAQHSQSTATLNNAKPEAERICEQMALSLGGICQRAAEETYRAAYASTLGGALSLHHVFGTENGEILVWLGLLVLLAVVLAVTQSGFVALLVIGGCYFALVVRGRKRAAGEASAETTASIHALAKLPVSPLLFTGRSSNNEFPIQAVAFPWEDREWVRIWRLNEQTPDSMRGCSMAEFMSPDRKTTQLIAQVTPARGEPRTPYIAQDINQQRMKVWLPIVAQFTKVIAPQINAFETLVKDTVLKRNAEAEAIVVLDKSIKALESAQQNWSDVAIPEQDLDKLLKLIDQFVSRPTSGIRGVLLKGPPGTGKTLLATRLAAHANCQMIKVGIADLKGQHIGATGPRVKQVWGKCIATAPAILFVDECESVFASRGSADSDNFGAELVQTFLSEWDAANQNGDRVFVVGATNRPDLLDTAIVSRFTETIALSAPDAEGRRNILSCQFAKAGLGITASDELIRMTSGMTGRDIQTLVAKVCADHVGTQPAETAFQKAASEIRKKTSTQVARVTWEDVIVSPAILDEFKTLGLELMHAQELIAKQMPPPKGILLYGPPGTGKTQIARALATESGLSFIAAAGSDLKGQYVGQSAPKVRELFDKARAQAPCIVFLDEIDALAPARAGADADSFSKDIVAQLLQEIDGVRSRPGEVFLLAASNHPQMIDSALLSRLERKIEITLPDKEDRIKILRLQLHGKPLAADVEAMLPQLADLTNNKSGRDIQSLVTIAARNAKQRTFSQKQSLDELQIKASDLLDASAQLAP